jgi:hypothetical protein
MRFHELARPRNPSFFSEIETLKMSKRLATQVKASVLILIL